MLIPMIIPIIYTLKYKQESLVDVIVIFLIMIGIVIFYWPLTISFYLSANIFSKFILFILFPLLIIFLNFKIKNNEYNNKVFNLSQFGLTIKELANSIKLGLIFIPLMLIVTFLVKYMINGYYDIDFSLGVISFFESFTEEFFFRGVLFLFLMIKTNLKIAYVTSLSSFILMHPQNFTNLFIISTLVQGLITLEICRRSRNLAGGWIVHGTNRFFSIVIYPLFM